MMRVLWTCPACGIQAGVRLWPVHCRCGFIQYNATTPGLGDYIAAGLQRVGVTPQRYANAKAALGLKKKCNCHQRQRKLNKIGHKLGIGKP